MSEVLIQDTSIAARDGYALAVTVFTATKIGHFGFFRPEHRDTLWHDASEWLAR